MEIIIFMLLLVIIMIIIKKFFQSDKVKSKFREMEKNNITIITTDELMLRNVNFYREIPFNKDKYYVFYLMTMIKNDDQKQNALIIFIKACIVDLIQKDILEIKKQNFTMELAIKEDKIEKLKDQKDIEFVRILQSIAVNNVLKIENFKNISKDGTDAIILWGINGFEYAQKLWYSKIPDDRHKDIAILIGLEKFLLEYSKIVDKSVEEVKIWEEYLTFAILLKIADNTVEELEKIIPDTFFIKILFQSRELVFQLLNKIVNKEEQKERNE